MATELEFVKYKDFVESLPVRTTAKSGDKTVVSNSTDGPGGETNAAQAQKVLTGNVAPAFDSTKPNGPDGFAYHIDEDVVYNGKTYRFIDNKTSGDWDASKVVLVDVVSDVNRKFDKIVLGRDIQKELVQTSQTFYFTGFSIGKGETFRIKTTKNSGASTGYALYVNGTSVLLKSGAVYGTEYEFVAPEYITRIVCYAYNTDGAGLSLTIDVKTEGLADDVERLGEETQLISGVVALNTRVCQNKEYTDYTYSTGSKLLTISNLDLVEGDEVTIKIDKLAGVSTALVLYKNSTAAANVIKATYRYGNTFRYKATESITKIIGYAMGADSNAITFSCSVIRYGILGKYNNLRKEIPVTENGLLGVAGSVNLIFEGADNSLIEETILVSEPVSQYRRVRVIPNKIPWNINNVTTANPIIFGFTCITEDGVEHKTLELIGNAAFEGDRKFFDCWIYPNTKSIKLRLRADIGETITLNISHNLSSGANAQLEFGDFLRASQNKLRRGSVLPQFALVGDPHNDGKGLLSAVRTFDELPDLVDFVLLMGDLCSDYPNAENAYYGYNSMIDKSRQTILPVIGNHDVGSWFYIGHYAPLATIVNNVMGPAIAKGFIPSAPTGYYYKDFADKKLRVVVLNLYENQGVYDASSNWEQVTYDSSAPQIALNTSYNVGDVVNVSPWTDYSYKAKVSLTTPATIPSTLTHDLPCFSTRPDGANIHQTQAQWLADTLLSTPEGYGVILAGHTSYSNRMLQVESKFMAKLQTNAEMQASFSVGIGGTNDIIADILDKFVNSQDASLTYTRGSETIEVDCEFSGKNEGVKYIGYVAGHLHYDAVTRHPTYTYQYAVHACASFIYNHKWTDLQYIDTSSRAYTNYTLVAPSLSDGGSNLIKVGLKMTDDGYLRDCARITQSE